MSGERFRRARELVELSQGQVATYADTGQGYLSDIELGKRWPSTWTLLQKLAAQYKVSADYLLGLTDDPDPVHTENRAAEAALLAALRPGERGEIEHLLRLALRMPSEAREALLYIAEALAGREAGPTPAEIVRGMREREGKGETPENG